MMVVQKVLLRVENLEQLWVVMMVEVKEFETVVALAAKKVA